MTSPRSESQGAGGPEPTKVECVHGELQLPPRAIGIVLMAHGTQGRLGVRNRTLATFFQHAGLGTGTFKLEEDSSRRDATTPARTVQLVRGLSGISQWVRERPECARLPAGYFGLGAGVDAALIAGATQPPSPVVLAGGRPDLHAELLELLRQPALLIASRGDREGLGAAVDALDRLPIRSELALVDGGEDLTNGPIVFEVARVAREWLRQQLTA